MLARRNIVVCWLCALFALAFSLTIVPGCGSKADPPVNNQAAIHPDDRPGTKAVAPETVSPEPVQFDEDAFKADPYKMPDGNNATLLYYIKKLNMNFRQASSEQEHDAELLKKAPVILEVAEKVLAAHPTPEQRRDATIAKLENLEVMATKPLVEEDRRSAQVALTKTAHALTSDSDEMVSQWARRKLIRMQIDEVVAAQGANADELITSLQGLLAGKYLGSIEFNLAKEIAGKLESLDQTGPALAAYNALGNSFGGEGMPRPIVDETKSRVESAERRLAIIGKPLEIAGTLIDETQFQWSDYRGKIVLIDFWATNCGRCVEELPNVKANYEKYHDKGFEVVGISLDDEKAHVTALLKEQNIPWKCLFSHDKSHTGWEHPLATKYGIFSLPVVLLVNQQGNVVTMNARGERLGELLAKMLDGETAPPPPKLPAETSKTETPKVDPSQQVEDKTSAIPAPAAPVVTKKSDIPPDGKSDAATTKTEAGKTEAAKNEPGKKETEKKAKLADDAKSEEPAVDDESKLSGNPYLPGKKTSLADLIELLGQMREKSAAIKKRAGFQEALVEVTNRVLASDSDIKAKTLATLAKLEALHAMSLDNDKSADEQIHATLATAKDNKDAELTREVLFQSLEQRTMESDDLKQEQLVPFLDEIEKYFGKEPPITRQSRLASGTVHLINRIEDNKVAKKQMIRFAPIFRKSKDQDLVRYGRKLAEASGTEEADAKE